MAPAQAISLTNTPDLVICEHRAFISATLLSLPHRVVSPRLQLRLRFNFDLESGTTGLVRIVCIIATFVCLGCLHARIVNVCTPSVQTFVRECWFTQVSNLLAELVYVLLPFKAESGSHVRELSHHDDFLEQKLDKVLFNLPVRV